MGHPELILALASLALIVLASLALAQSRALATLDAHSAAIDEQASGRNRTAVEQQIDMNGGPAAASIDAILSLRQKPPVQGWGHLVQGLDLSLGAVVSSVHSAAEAFAQSARLANAVRSGLRTLS